MALTRLDHVSADGPAADCTDDCLEAPGPVRNASVTTPNTVRSVLTYFATAQRPVARRRPEGLVVEAIHLPG